jgi:hypothetical protein
VILTAARRLAPRQRDRAAAPPRCSRNAPLTLLMPPQRCVLLELCLAASGRPRLLARCGCNCTRTRAASDVLGRSEVLGVLCAALGGCINVVGGQLTSQRQGRDHVGPDRNLVWLQRAPSARARWKRVRLAIIVSRLTGSGSSTRVHILGH